MAKVAFMTLAVLQEPLGHPSVQGFVDRLDSTFAAAATSLGLLELLSISRHNRPAAFQGQDYDLRIPQTLSVWQDLESVFAYAYGGMHAEALRKSGEWFVHNPQRSYVAWWVADDHKVSREEAYGRYDRLCLSGAGAQAFDFKQPFGADGQPYELDRTRVRRIIAGNQINTLVGHYLAAWNEPDAHERMKLLETIWMDDATYTDPTASVSGRTELNTHIGKFLGRNPGATLTVQGKADFHHTHLRFFWTLHLGNGTEIEGMDYAEVSATGKLQRIIGFFDIS